MKKIISILLIVCFLASFVGCGNNVENNSTNDNNDTIFDSIKDSKDATVTYSDDQILFIANDRCDVEDDRDTIYAYNYKGEQINTDETMAYFSFYSENGLAPAYDQGSGMVGFVDKEGVFQIEPKYDDAAPFSHNGIALVKKEQAVGNEEDCNYIYKYGYINSKGEEIIPCIYDGATSFLNCGYALASTEKETIDEEGFGYPTTDKHYILDEKGNIVVEIDVEVEKREIIAVFDGYYVCEYYDSNVQAVFDFSGNKLDECKRENENPLYNTYDLRRESLYKYTYEEKIDESGIADISLKNKQVFDGEKFVDLKYDVEFTSKRVATTQSGLGYGLEKNGEIIIPFEYDEIISFEDYYLAIQYTGYNEDYEQTIDIYDSNFNKTADNIPYAFDKFRYGAYGERCDLPEGYIPIVAENDDYGEVYGIVDCQGNVIVEPVHGRGITVYSYEGMGYFLWRAWA